MSCFFNHKWDGCKCLKCGKIRDKEHDWVEIFRETRTLYDNDPTYNSPIGEEEYVICRCEKCGKTI